METPSKKRVLVVANRTVDSPDLLAAIKDRAAKQAIMVTVLVPTPWADRESAQVRLDGALSELCGEERRVLGEHDEAGPAPGGAGGERADGRKIFGLVGAGRELGNGDRDFFG